MRESIQQAIELLDECRDDFHRAAIAEGRWLSQSEQEGYSVLVRAQWYLLDQLKVTL